MVIDSGLVINIDKEFISYKSYVLDYNHMGVEDLNGCTYNFKLL